MLVNKLVFQQVGPIVLLECVRSRRSCFQESDKTGDACDSL